MNHIHHLWRRLRSMAPGAIVRLIRSLKIPMVLFGVCCYQFYHYQRIKTTTQPPMIIPRQRVSLEPFSYELYDRIKDDENVIILIDMGYTQDFENRLHGILADLVKVTQGNPRRLRMLTLQLKNREEKAEFQKRYEITIPRETIFLIKNQYVETLQDFSFENIFDHPRTLSIYFAQVPVLTPQQREKLCANINELTHQEFLLLFYCPRNDTHYPDMERVFKNIEVAVSEHPLADKAVLIMLDNPDYLGDFSLEGAEPGSLHLLQKYSDKYSLQPSNASVCKTPFNLMRNIKLLSRQGQLLIPLHLDKLSTFSNIMRDYEMKLTVDKNRITRDGYRNLVKVFQKLKIENAYPNVGFSLKYDEIKERDTPFLIKMVDHKKYQRSMEVLDGRVTDATERAELGKHTYEYLFDKDTVTEEKMREFIQQVLSGQCEEYYRTAKLGPLASIDRLTARNFNDKVLKDGHDHLVLQYSSHCSGCKAVAPYLLDFQASNPNKNLKMHRINAIKNDVAGQLQYPFTPVLLLYKNGWKPHPVQFDLNNILQRPGSLHDFVEVTSEVQPLSEALLSEHYSQVAGAGWQHTAPRPQAA